MLAVRINRARGAMGVLCWGAGDVARVLGINERVVRRWLSGGDGRDVLPEAVVVWLERVAGGVAPLPVWGHGRHGRVIDLGLGACDAPGACEGC